MEKRTTTTTNDTITEAKKTSTTPETMLKTLVKYISGTILDDPPISVDFDGDFKKVGNGAVVGVVDSCDGGVVGVVVTDVMVAVGSGGYDDEVG
ncbi:hypothetical protein FXO38_17841 [Capsicum annuum]|nr:hypothetical protein FXO38_17841 [Capsicum annuum]